MSLINRWIHSFDSLHSTIFETKQKKYQIDQLHQASQRGNIDEFQYLLDRYSLICSRDRLGSTPLHKAVLFGHYDLIKFIIKNFDQNILYIGDNVSCFEDVNISIYSLVS